VVGLGALLIYRQVKSEIAGSWYAHMALVASIYVSVAALPRFTLGGLYLAWKRFDSRWIAATCLVDGLFWTFLASHERAPIGVALAIFAFGALHLAASWIFVHPSVRHRHAEAAA
jgi:hypothetical protein